MFEEFGCCEIKLFQIKKRAFSVSAKKTGALLGFFIELNNRFVDISEQHQSAVFADVVKEGFRLIKKERKIVLNSGGRNPVFDVFVERNFGRVAGKFFSPASAE